MAIKITHEPGMSTASVELRITRPLPDFDLKEVKAHIPREIDPVVASQGFKDLLDEARSILESLWADASLEIAQLTGPSAPTARSFGRASGWCRRRRAPRRARRCLQACASTSPASPKACARISSFLERPPRHPVLDLCAP